MRGAFGIYRRETARFMRVKRQTLLAPLITSGLFYLIFGISLGKNIPIAGFPSYLLFLIPGLTALALLMNPFENNASSLIIGRYGKETQDFRIVPLSSLELIWGFAFSGLTRGVIVAILTFTMGQCVHYSMYGTLFSVAHPWLALGFGLMASSIFAFFGTGVGMRARSFDHYSTIYTFILTPLTYLGGAFYDITSLPPAWQLVSRCNPIAYLIAGMRYAFCGEAFASFGLILAVTIASLIATFTFALIELSRAENYQ